MPKKIGFHIQAELLKDDIRVTYKSDSYPLNKEETIIFTPLYKVPNDCYAIWQITNTGSEAMHDNGLRGDFDSSNMIKKGLKIVRKEFTRYKGRHLVRCYIMRNNKECVAMSEYFIVWIK